MLYCILELYRYTRLEKEIPLLPELTHLWPSLLIASELWYAASFLSLSFLLAIFLFYNFCMFVLLCCFLFSFVSYFILSLLILVISKIDIRKLPYDKRHCSHPDFPPLPLLPPPLLPHPSSYPHHQAIPSVPYRPGQLTNDVENDSEECRLEKGKNLYKEL